MVINTKQGEQEKRMLKEVKFMLFFGALYMCLGIIVGAFAAHGLKESVSEYQLGVLQTGVKYQLVHGLGLLLLAVLFAHYQKRLYFLAGVFIVIGVFLFSFSLYAIAVLNFTYLGVMTPIGGTLMIAGWLMLMYSVVKG